MKKRLLALFLVLGLCASMTVPAAAADNSIKQVEAGYLFSMILTNGGDLYGCGLNTPNGQPLGTDVEMITDPGAGGDIVPRPQKITEDVVKIASSKSPSSQNVGSYVSGGHTLILKEGGKLYGLGDNYCGQLGQGDRKQHPGLQYIMDDVVEISCSGTASFAITEDGELYWWGLLMQQNSGNAQYIFEPSPVKALSGVKTVDGGAEHVVALKTDGTVWTMGSAYAGALGDGQSQGFADDFIQVFSGAVDVSAGSSYTMALTANGTLYGWGKNSSGQLGVSSTAYDPVLTPIQVMTGVKTVECGYYTTHVIKTDNSLWSMGWNYHGEMGLGNEGQGGLPKKSLSGVASVSGGYFHTLALKTDGSMYGCGQSYYYELGDGVRDYQVLSWVPAGLTASPIPGTNTNPFTDVKSSDYFYESVQWAVENYITNGTTTTTFSPSGLCTRAQILTFLFRASKDSAPSYVYQHKDVTAGDWFIEAVRWAAWKDIIPETGYVYPNDPCTRAAAVEFMWKYAGSPAYDTSSLPFTDVKSSDSYAQAVAWALDQGVTTGTSSTTFSPGATCTRAQIATFLYRAFA